MFRVWFENPCIRNLSTYAKDTAGIMMILHLLIFDRRMPFADEEHSGRAEAHSECRWEIGEMGNRRWRRNAESGKGRR